MTVRYGGKKENTGAVSCATTREKGDTGKAGASTNATASSPCIALIWAMARNRVIGRDNALPWHLPADMRHFRELTTGHPVLMGRKTFESLGSPLPGRTNIVVTSNRNFAAKGCLVAHSLGEALAQAIPHTQPDDPLLFVIGGAQLYTQALPYADRLYVTQVEAEIEGDAQFPDFDRTLWREIEKVSHPADDKNHYAYFFQTLERKIPRT